MRRAVIKAIVGHVGTTNPDELYFEVEWFHEDEPKKIRSSTELWWKVLYLNPGGDSIANYLEALGNYHLGMPQKVLPPLTRMDSRGKLHHSSAHIAIRRFATSAQQSFSFVVRVSPIVGFNRAQEPACLVETRAM